MFNRLVSCVAGLFMASSTMAAGCFVSNFKGAVMSINVEERRAQAAYDWLKAEVEACSVDKLTIIRNNSPSWLGTALNPQIEALIEAAIEAKASEDPELLKKLFETKIARPADPPPMMSGSSGGSPSPRQPVVAPMNITGNISGSITNIDINTKGNVDDATPADNSEANENALSYEEKRELEKQVKWNRDMERKIASVKTDSDVAQKLKQELLAAVSTVKPIRSYQQRVEWEQDIKRKYDELVRLAKG